MFGHTLSTCHDIKMKGIEFLRGMYIASGISIKPKTRISEFRRSQKSIEHGELKKKESLPR